MTHKTKNSLDYYCIQVGFYVYKKTSNAVEKYYNVDYFDLDGFSPIIPDDIDVDGIYQDWHFNDSLKRLNQFVCRHSSCGCCETIASRTVVSVKIFHRTFGAFDPDKYAEAYEKEMGWIKVWDQPAGSHRKTKRKTKEKRKSGYYYKKGRSAVPLNPLTANNT